jgi:hypothetical protein
MGIPGTYPSTCTDVNETGCCPVPNVSEWDRRTIGLNAAAGATMPPVHGLILSRDISAWRAEPGSSCAKHYGRNDVIVLGRLV